MFHWICPECGREIPPQVKECPVCDANAAASAPPEPTPAAILQTAVEVPAQASPPEPRAAIAEPRPEVPDVAQVPEVVAVAEAPVEAASEPIADVPAIEDMVEAAAPEAPVVEQAAAEQVAAAVPEPVAAEPAIAESEVAEPVVAEPAVVEPAIAEPATAEPVVSEEAAPVPELAVSEEPAAHAAVPEPPATSEPEPEALPEPVAVAEPVAVLPAPAEIPPPPTPDSPIPDPLLRLAQKLRETQMELAAASAHSAPPVAPSVRVHANAAPPPVQKPSLDMQPLASSPVLLLEAAPGAIALLAPVEVAAEPVVENHTQPEPEPTPEPEPEPVAVPASAGRIGRPEPSLSVSPPSPKRLDLEALLAALPAPQRDAVRNAPTPAALGLGALQDSTAIGGRIRPAEQAAQILKSQTGPSISLPGPALPRALNSLKDAGISKILTNNPKTAKKRSWSWVSGLIAAIVVMSSLVAFQMYTATHDSTPARPAAHVAAPQSVEAAPIPTEPVAAASYPLSKSVEVTGLRFVGENASELRYLLVNHSAMDLSAVTLYVTVRSATAKPGQAPLYRFSFRAPSLGPLESKEMSTTLDKPLRAGADWQGLHADVEVGQ